MTTTMQIRAEVETALRFKAIVERLGIPQGKALEAMITLMEKELGIVKESEGGAKG